MWFLSDLSKIPKFNQSPKGVIGELEERVSEETNERVRGIFEELRTHYQETLEIEKELYGEGFE